MKVIPLNPVKTLTATEKLIAAILQKNPDAFKAISKQFIHNNQAYLTGFSGMIA
jgi:hypothetical protein